MAIQLHWFPWSPHYVKRVYWGLCVYVIVHTIWPPSPVILWIELGGKPKWLPLSFGCHGFKRTGPIRFEFCPRSNHCRWCQNFKLEPERTFNQRLKFLGLSFMLSLLQENIQRFANPPYAVNRPRTNSAILWV